MADSDLKDVFKEAAEIAKAVPATMQEAAFNRALDLLLHGRPSRRSSAGERNADPTATSQGRRRPRRTAPRGPDGAKDPVERILQELDRTMYPQIAADNRVLENGLWVLRAVKDSLHVDGLTPAQVARVLTEKFRVRTSRQAANQALSHAGKLVDRFPQGSGYAYRLMGAGEKHLDSPDESSKPAPQKQRRSSRKSPKSESTETPPASKSTTPRRPASGRPGPRAALDAAVTSGFFDQPQTMGSVQKYLAEKRGYTYKLSDLSPTLVRLLRDGVLDRHKNADGQYEYVKR